MFKILQSNPSYTEKVFFRVSQMCIWIVPIERAWKTDLENGMVCYASMKTSRDMNDQKSIKSEKSAESAK